MVVFKRGLLTLIFCFIWANAQATHINKFYTNDQKFNDVSVGYGYHQINYKKDGAAVVDVDFKDERFNDFMLYYEHRMLKDWGYNVSFNLSQGSVSLSNASVAKPDYKFMTVDFEVYSYHFFPSSHRYAYGPKLGAEYNVRPFLHVDSNSAVQIHDLTSMSPYVGGFFDIQSNRWLISTNLNYLYPLSAKTDSGKYDGKNKTMVKASFEVNYLYTPNFRVGIEWQGLFYQNGFDYNDGTSASSGEETTTMSSVLFNLNFLY